jgi:hypothetical protein
MRENSEDYAPYPRQDAGFMSAIIVVERLQVQVDIQSSRICTARVRQRAGRDVAAASRRDHAR